MKINFVGLIKLAIIVLVAMAIFIVITSKTDKIYGLRSFVVLTGSMEPNVPQGSLIFTQKRPLYQKNDVVAFKQGNITITHRIVKTVSVKQVAQYITKGDANNALDSKRISHADILGKEIIFAPYIGKFILTLRTLPGFIFFVILPALILIGLEIRVIVAEIKKEAVKRIPRQENLI